MVHKQTYISKMYGNASIFYMFCTVEIFVRSITIFFLSEIHKIILGNHNKEIKDMQIK